MCRKITLLSIHSILFYFHFQNNADVKCVDQDGRTCLAYAKAAASIASSKVPSDATATATCNNLVELLLSYGCSEVSSVSISGTIPRRRPSQNNVPQYEKLPSSVI